VSDFSDSARAARDVDRGAAGATIMIAARPRNSPRDYTFLDAKSRGCQE